MINRFLFLFFMVGPLYSAPPQRDYLQEMRLSLDQMRYQVHSHGVEIDLFQERVQKLEATLASLKQSSSDRTIEKRLMAVEKAHEALISDFKTLKTHLNETTTALAQCQSKLSKIDKTLSSDIQGLKNSLQSMLVLLQQKPVENGAIYTVQSGDSLSQIAVDHKVDLKALKELNQLASDKIFVGQKLHLPQN